MPKFRHENLLPGIIGALPPSRPSPVRGGAGDKSAEGLDEEVAQFRSQNLAADKIGP
jgi:hypothetical protein